MMDRRILLGAAAVVCITALLLSGCVNPLDGLPKFEEVDSDGDGIPDAIDDFPFIYDWGLNLTYLDDTQESEMEWRVKISSTTDYGVLIVDNTGVKNDEIQLMVASQPEGWSVSIETTLVALDNVTLVPVVVQYNVPSGATGGLVTILGRSQGAFYETNRSIHLICEVESTSGEVTKKGDKCSVDYTLWDTDGNQIDSGTLPATAGERYVGPLENLGYITGFYMGILGMKKAGGILGLLGTGETKKIRVPPELAYGTDPDKHQLGGMVLIFQIVLRSST